MKLSTGSRTKRLGSEVARGSVEGKAHIHPSIRMGKDIKRHPKCGIGNNGAATIEDVGDAVGKNLQ